MLSSISVSEAQLNEIERCRASLGICSNLSCLAVSKDTRNRAKMLCSHPVSRVFAISVLDFYSIHGLDGTFLIFL